MPTAIRLHLVVSMDLGDRNDINLNLYRAFVCDVCTHRPILRRFGNVHLLQTDSILAAIGEALPSKKLTAHRVFMPFDPPSLILQTISTGRQFEDLGRIRQHNMLSIETFETYRLPITVLL